jgi:hypothetical protein
MGRADDRSRRARLDAAADLCGVDRTRRRPPQSTPPRSNAMEQERVAPLSLHRSPRAKPRRLGADFRTIAPNPQKPAGH